MQLCRDEHHAALKDFAQVMCRCYAAAEDPDFAVDADLSRQVFETHMQACSGATGKRWKDWLFARVEMHDDDPLTLLETGAALCVRTATRALVAREGHSKPKEAGVFPIFMDAAMDPCEKGGATVGDRLGLTDSLDPAGLGQWRDLCASAACEARKVCDGLSERQRIAMAAWSLDLSRANPAVTRAAGCGRQAVYDAWQAVAATAKDVAQARVSDGAELADAYANLLLHNIGDQCVEWARAEKRCRALFSPMRS